MPIARRRGLTLLECLVAIFIVAIGMIGTFALLPVAQKHVQEAQEHGHVGTAGRGAWKEVRIRRLLEPSKWMVVSQGVEKQIEKEAFVIDPLFYGRQIELWGKFSHIQRFPYADYTANGGAKIQRASLREWQGSDKPMSRQQAERIFIWEDDLLFTVNDEDNQLQMSPTTVDGEHLAVKGQFSWLVMAVPENGDEYRASVVVFRDRPLGEPRLSERLLDVTLVSGGYGGGDVLVRSAPASKLQNGREDAEALVRAVPGEWIMLCGTTNPIDSSDADARAESIRRVFTWYEIIATAPTSFNESTEVASRRLTIKGPTWPAGSDPGQIPPDNTWAALFTGAVGVYEKTVQLE